MLRSRSTLLFAAAAAIGLATVPAPAAQVTFVIQANGQEEVNASGVPNQGDLDGSATGFIILDNGTGSGSTGSATFSLTLTNIDISDLRGHHIHQQVAGLNGLIVVDFGDPDNLRTGNTLTGPVSGLPAATITSIFANPTGFYYNLHNGVFQAGAVRDQLPEPGCVGLVGVGAIGLLAGRRKRRA